MPHEVDGQVHWHEPSGLSAAGVSRYLRPKLAYDRFMECEGLPVLRTGSVAALSDLARAPWRRIGGRGAFLQMFGTEGGLGCALIDIPASGALRAEKHLFEEIVLVLQGRGTTELWLEDSARRVMFEWQEGSLFSIPANALHRMVNATDAPALLFCGTNAPAMVNLLGDADAVFANPFVFRERFDDETGQAFDDIEPDPVRGLALCRTNLVPDVVRCDLPLDNRHSPGYRQMALSMTGPGLECAVGEHRPGRYAKAHLLPAGMVKIGLAGEGFCYRWPACLGPTPWQDGSGDAVLRCELGVGSIFAAGPGGGRWYHQVFNTGATPLRHLAWSVPERQAGPPGEEMRDDTAVDRADGGSMIPYSAEDPFLRAEYAGILARDGRINRMKADDYSAEAG
jgi:quercetin dioxygenase-like cupin family protein